MLHKWTRYNLGQGVYNECDRPSLLRWFFPIFALGWGLIYLSPMSHIYAAAPTLYAGIERYPPWVWGLWSVSAGVPSLLGEVMRDARLRMAGALIHCSLLAVLTVLFYGHSEVSFWWCALLTLFKTMHATEQNIRLRDKR